jgi:multisubunit Na+/H+ antiporter MnhG subunit
VSVRHVMAVAVLALGVGLEVLAVIGVSCVRGALDRLHYVGPAGFGALLIGLSVLLQQSFSLIGDKALATGILVLVLGLVLVHATARSLRTRQLGDWRAGAERVTEDRR